MTGITLNLLSPRKRRLLNQFLNKVEKIEGRRLTWAELKAKGYVKVIRSIDGPPKIK